MYDPEKFIKKLPASDAERIKETLAKILQEDFIGLSFKKLQGYADLFRVRVGKYRIIFKKHKTYGTIIVKVSRRNENTYENL